MQGAVLLSYGLLGISFAGVGLGAWYLLNPRRTAVDRVRALTGGADEGAPEVLVQRAPPPGLSRKIARLATSGDAEELTLQRQRMLQAGLRGPTAVEQYNVARVGLTVFLPLVTALLLPPLPLAALAAVVLITAALGYYGPAGWLARRTRTRQGSILQAFPDALDLLVSSAEAGLGLDAAFDRVAREMEGVSPELSLELQIVGHEVAAGMPRSDALRRLGQRTGLPAVVSLVNVLVQADKLGTSVAMSLRVHANMVRTRRMLAAEEEAAKISPKMTVAMILLLLPALFVVILGPAIVNMVRQLAPTLGIT